MKKTIKDVFWNTAKIHSERTAVAYLEDGQYKKISYSELAKLVRYISGEWSKLEMKQGSKLAVMLPNSPEWIITDLVAAEIGLIVVPIHSTYKSQFIEKIISHSDARCLVIHDQYVSEFEKVADSVDLNHIIVVGGSNSTSKYLQWGSFASGDHVQSLRNRDLSPNDVHTIIYTSGTTGDPKGVMLSHKNIIADVVAAKEKVSISHHDRFFSFLPLSHAFERVAGYYAPLSSGSSIYFARSSKTIVDDIKLAKPTVLSSVPRIFEKIYDRIFDKMRSASKFKQLLFYSALNLSRLKIAGTIKKSQYLKLTILDKLVLRKLRDILGGNVRLAISGGASLNPAIAKFFENIRVSIIEGYGLTETAPIVAVNRLEEFKYGTVGKPISCNIVKISETKEILVKGDNVMVGYYKDDAATKQAIKNGWFHTGDVGFLDSDGFLSIIGRAKDIIILSTGKNVMPEPIEYKLNENKYISQSIVFGNNEKTLSAYVVPDFDELKKWCISNKLDFNLPAILEMEPVKDLFVSELKGTLQDLSSTEQIASFKLMPKEFSQEEGLLTPTLKLRRSQILAKYS